MIETYYEVNPDDVVSEEIDKGQFIIELKDGSEKGIKIHDLEEKGLGRRKIVKDAILKSQEKQILLVEIGVLKMGGHLSRLMMKKVMK